MDSHIVRELPSQLQPRKLPRQKRAVATVDAILEATLQVLAGEGAARLNTSLVAERAGVSVGTLYQYFPNKKALQYAVLERHTGLLAEAFEAARDCSIGGSLDAIAGHVVKAYFVARAVRSHAAAALYDIATELDARELIDVAMQRSARALEEAIESACDADVAMPRLLARTMISVIYGAVPPICQSVVSAEATREAEVQLTIMLRAYLGAHRCGAEPRAKDALRAMAIHRFEDTTCTRSLM